MPYEIGRPSGQCAVTGRQFQPGEEFVSVLLETANGWQRREYALEAWETVMPEGVVGFWHGQMPATDAKIDRPKPISTEAIMEWFDGWIARENQLSDQEHRLVYVTSLLLVRRKALKLHDVERTDEGEFLVLKRPRGRGAFKVRDPGISEERIVELEQELTHMLEHSDSPVHIAPIAEAQI